jgi:putative ABC transport system ATP-binding protein
MTYPGPPAVRALSEVNLTVNRGDFLAVVGPSGSGKSTLLNVLGLLDRPTSGSYELAGTDVADLSERDRAAVRGQHIGFVFQSFHLLDQRSALENVLLAGLYQPTRSTNAKRDPVRRHKENRGSRDRLRQRAEEVLTSVGMAHRIGALPSRLSGGERQRVAIARALLNQPELLLCDEPTGNLDTVNSANVLRLLGEVHHSGQTVVMITHDPTVAAAANRRVSITDGALTEVS